MQGSDEVVRDIREAYNRAVSEVKAIERTALDKYCSHPQRARENLNWEKEIENLCRNAVT